VSGNLVKRAAFALLLCAISQQGFAASSSGATEDRLIVEGLFYQDELQYPRALRIFLRLYRMTGKAEYLLQAAGEAMAEGAQGDLVIPELRSWLRRHGHGTASLRVARTLAALYLQNSQWQKAEKVVRRWLAESSDPKDLRLAATVMMRRGKDEEAVRLLQKAYAKTMDERTLLEEVTLLANDLHRPERAISLLESRLRMEQKNSTALYFKLIELYAKEKRLDKVLEVYKKLYENDPQPFLLQKIVKLSLYGRDYAGLSRFLEKHPGNEKLLYMLYKEQKRYDKAIALAKRRYEETHRPKWLAEEAILIFEEAKARKKTDPEAMKTFRSLFDRALKEGVDDSLYLNYYGYTLIDEGWDLDRGIDLVRRALRQQPENPYYLDSLAWGLYKKGECDEAYRTMQKVIDAGGLKEAEIKKHWQKIQKCMGPDHASE